MRYRTLRRLLWAGIALCVVALALGLTEYLLGRQPGVTEANLARVRGLTLAEVEALLGVPASAPDHGFRNFISPKREASVFFDEQGLAVFAVSRPAGTPRPALMARLRAWLGW
jgi:hypothetical protein